MFSGFFRAFIELQEALSFLVICKCFDFYFNATLSVHSNKIELNSSINFLLL